MALMIEAVKVLPHSPEVLVDMSDQDILIKLDNITSQDIKYRNWQKVKVNIHGKKYKQTQLTHEETDRNTFNKIFMAEILKFRPHSGSIRIQYLLVRTIYQAEHGGD